VTAPSPRRLPHRRALFATIIACVIAGACATGEDADSFDPTPWVTTVDSAGDTTVVRIAGDVPATHVRSMVAELTVGAEDGSDEETFGGIGTVMGTPDGGLLVHDQQAVAVRLFDSTGAHVRTIGRKGGGPGEYDQLNGIVRLPDERIVIWDATGARLNFYSATGDFLSTARMPITGWFSQNILSSDRAASLYARGILERHPTDFTQSKGGFIRMDTTGRVLDSIPLLEWHEDVPPLTARSTDGRSMTASGVPFMASNVTRLLPDGGLASGGGDPYRFYLVGGSRQKPVRVEREHEPVPVSEAESSQRREQITRNMTRLNPSWTWTGAAIPSHKPAYRGMEVGVDGRIWILVSAPAEPIPDAEMPPVREGQPAAVRITTREPIVYDVFSPEGRLLGRVALPTRTRLYRMEGDHAWGVRRDSLDVEYAVRFRIDPALPRDQ
jgi:hypothetical protein